MAGRFFILAGEASGDTLGAEVMQACKRAYGPCSWFGMGGPKMGAEGLSSEEDMEELSIIGIAGVVVALPRLASLSDRLLEQIMQDRPDAVFTIDSKMFSVRFALRLKQRMRAAGWSVPIIHVVAPSIWAWGKWRKNGFEDAFDGLICLFPFEPALFNQEKVKAVFSGHPAAWRSDLEAHSHHNNTKRDKNLICLLPGSRRREIMTHLPVFLQACETYQKDYNPWAQFCLPTLPYLRPRIEAICTESSLKHLSILDDKGAVSESLTRASSTLCVSGTVTLEAALAGLPGTVCYTLSWLDRLFAQMFVSLTTPVLPDIILAEAHYPVLLTQQVTHDNLVAALLKEREQYETRRGELDDVSKRLRGVLRTDEPDFVSSLQSCLKHIL